MIKYQVCSSHNNPPKREREREREAQKSMANQTWIFIELNLLCSALCLLFAHCELCKQDLITEMRNITKLFLSHESSKRREMLKRVRWQT